MSLVSSFRPKPGLISVQFQWIPSKQQKILKSFSVKGSLVRYILKGRVGMISKKNVQIDFKLTKRAMQDNSPAAECDQKMANFLFKEERPLAVWVSFNNNSKLHYLFETADNVYSKSKLPLKLEEETEAIIDFNISLDFGHDIRACDTIITANSEQNIPVHSASLCKASPVFASMFTHEMTESLSKTIVIEDIDYDIVKILLLYIYRGSIIPCIPEMGFETFCSLYSASDKYDIRLLKKECLSNLRYSLTTNNVISILRWAEFYSITTLRQAAVNYIADKSIIVFGFPEWKEVISNFPDVAAEVHERIASTRGTSHLEFS